MAKHRLRWLADLSTGFKRHRRDRDRLRVISSELPLKPGELAEAAARTGCCSLVDALLAGPWNWPADAGKTDQPMH